jgi:hypothetical protein
VDANKLTLVLVNFGTTFGVPNIAGVPEPTCVVLPLATGAVSLLGFVWRKRRAS